ncbi:hypothetical protein IJS77_01670 [bacterium]|nr:hypothetical protein [bacterium]
MYFLEILTRIFNKNNLMKLIYGKKVVSSMDDETQKCEHMFVPIDSTGKVFSCINCGLTINKKPKNINFFEEDK